MDYKVELIKVADLKPYEKNAKQHDESQVEQIAKSIKQFGFKQNLVVDSDNVVIIGHGRLMAAKKLGLKEVPCVRADDLTEEQIKALRIADNKLAEKSFWDNDLLAEELRDIGDDIKMTDFGFGDFELEILMGDYEPEPFNDDELEEYTKNGEVGLVKKRVIITYSDDDTEAVKKLLGLDEISKVVYEIKELTK